MNGTNSCSASGKHGEKRSCFASRSSVRNAKKMSLFALLAHELRNPLNAILGWLAILRTGREDERLLAKGLKTIERSARSQDRLIEDVFDLSRTSSGNLRLNAEPMLLNEAVAQAIESIRPAAQIKNISLETAASTESILILGDSDRIKQAIINILSNAVKFTGEDGRVLVTVICSDSIAGIVIKDNGRGVSSEFLPRIFDRYSQVDKSSMRG